VSVSGDERPATTDDFLAEVSGPLKQALVGALGQQRGQDAHAYAMAYAWEHSDRLIGMSSPVGYLFKVGRSSVRYRRKQIPVSFATPDPADLPEFEPRLPAVMGALPEKQRLAVVLVVGYGWSFAEVGRLTGKSEATVRGLVDRGMRRLRRDLDVEETP